MAHAAVASRPGCLTQCRVPPGVGRCRAPQAVRPRARRRFVVASSATAVAPAQLDEGRIFGPGRDGVWDAVSLGGPVVRCYMGDDETRWFLWYHARGPAFTATGPPLEPGATGCIGLAVSTDGVAWRRGEGPVQIERDKDGRQEMGSQDVGLCLEPNPSDWWSFDTQHVGVSDVQILSSGTAASASGVWWMFYYGAGGLCIRPGLAMSQDGRNWARIEGEHHTGALLDVGPPGAWDAAGVSRPQVILHGPGDLRMYYTACDPVTRVHSVGVAFSPDGFRWVRSPGGAPVFSGGSPGAFDAKGAASANVVRESRGGGYVMMYEAVDDAGRRTIGAARSLDGLTWRRCSDGPALAAAQDPTAWDAGGVGAPCAVEMAAGRWRLYYEGTAVGCATPAGVGLALSVGSGDDALRFRRRRSGGSA